MSGSDPRDPRVKEFIEWITPRRAEILERLWAVKCLSDAARTWATDAGDDLTHVGAKRAYAWNRLVGVSFTLWRALPLLAPSESKAPSSGIQIDHAELLLNELLLHNRVLYEQDRSTRDWMAGFYLNCAEDRIRSVVEDELKTDVSGWPSDKLTHATVAAQRAASVGPRDATDRRTRWDDAQKALGELSNVLRVAVDAR